AGWDQGQVSDIRRQGVRGEQGYCDTQVITCRPLARCGLETCQTCQSLTHDQRDAGLFDRMLIQGWFSIANCDYEEARETFKILRHENPSDPRPKIGLAIAQGLTSWEGLSARTMRKAVDLAPGILLEMPYSGAIQAKLRELLCKLKKRMKYDCANPDVLFMVGAIKTMLGDIEGADRAIHEAIEAGDCSISAKKLLDTLHRKQRCFMQSRQSQGQNRDSFRFDFNFD
ncbi:MAG: hypothetical protein O7G85_15405, partial [Planctomycetota bacterium]|nr:hypothetical protein [Planctomycetota bacterium]